MSVLMKVSVSYHELYGLSLVVSDIDPLYTIGDMQRQRQETINRLVEEGVYEMNRQLDMPVVIQNIAVVSSRNAAGYRDFMNELSACHYHFTVELFDSFMQGNETEESVISALDQIAGRLDEFDAVVVIRGGGSQSDLAAFDAYRLCCHLAQFPIPVITGIGHDKDQSVADLVAAVSLKTPTAVAAYLVDAVTELDNWLESARQEIIEIAVNHLEEESRFLQSSAFSLSRTSMAMTRSIELKLERLAGELRRRSATVMAEGVSVLENYSRDINRSVKSVIDKERSRLRYAGSIVDSRRPDKILALGFAIVTHNGRAVKNADALGEGDQVSIKFAEGKATADIKTISNGKK